MLYIGVKKWVTHGIGCFYLTMQEIDLHGYMRLHVRIIHVDKPLKVPVYFLCLSTQWSVQFLNKYSFHPKMIVLSPGVFVPKCLSDKHFGMKSPGGRAIILGWRKSKSHIILGQ